jgi:hypothetical protein
LLRRSRNCYGKLPITIVQTCPCRYGRFTIAAEKAALTECQLNFRPNIESGIVFKLFKIGRSNLGRPAFKLAVAGKQFFAKGG